MHRSKFDIGGADAGAGGMSMISGSGGASGMGASSSSSDAFAMAQSTGSSGAGSGSMCLEKSLSWAWSAATPAQCSPTGQVNHSRKREKMRKNRQAVRLACARDNSRLLPSAPRASRALQGPGRRCTSAARRASLYKTAPASCRRPGTRTGRR